MRKLLVIFIALLIPASIIPFALALGEVSVSKVDDTSVSIEKTTTDNNTVSLKELKARKNAAQASLQLIDEATAKRRQAIVDKIAELDKVIADSEALGVKDEVVAAPVVDDPNIIEIPDADDERIPR